MSKYIISIGEMLIDFIPGLPSSGEVVGTPCYHPHPGGAPANVVVAIARLGGAARFIGKLSEDGFGQLLAGGERQFTFYRTGTADTLLEVSDLDWNAWQDTAICHAGSVSLSIEPSRSATLAALDYTPQAGCIASFDAKIRPALWASNADIQDAIEDVIGRTNVLKFSAEEAVFMSELETLPAADLDMKQLYTLGADLLTRGPSLVIITLDARGALLMTADSQVEVPASPVSPVGT